MPRSRSPRRRPEKTTSETAKTTQQAGPWLLLFAALSLVLAGIGTYAVLDSFLLRVQSVRVRGTESLDRATLAQISGLRGHSILSLPLADARTRLLEVPEVRSVSFQRRWPRGVTIQVEERRPWALWSVAGVTYTIDADGVVLASGLPEGVPLTISDIAGDRALVAGDIVAPAAVALAARLSRESPRFIGHEVSALEYREGIGLTAVLSNGLRVTFGDERAYEFKVAVLANLLDELSARGEAPSSVDLRFGTRVTFE